VSAPLAYVPPARPTMTLRDLLAVHAPAVPDWFKPTMEKRRPNTPPVPDDLSERAAEMAEGWRRDPVFDLYDTALESGLFNSDNLDKLRQYELACADTWKAKTAWDEAERVQRLAQWPWAYADMVLAQRNPRCEECSGPVDDDGYCDPCAEKACREAEERGEKVHLRIENGVGIRADIARDFEESRP
jgi:hypothetical protein